MDIQQRYETAQQLLKKYNQQHLLTFWEQLDSANREKLLEKIENIEFDTINEKIERFVLNDAPIEIPKDFSAATAYPAVAKTDEQKIKYKQAEELGNKLLSQGKVAAFVVAGGQGTRLGFNGPKGDFPVSPIKNKTLFNLFAESIRAAGQKFGFQPAWYIMTSPLNHEATVKIFESNDYYQLGKENVFFFQQGTEINFSAEGKILLAEKGLPASSPDGHGGSLKALYKSGAVADMQKRGVEHISYFQVDNPLINIFDPLFIGLHASDEAEMSSKTLIKSGPFEKVGNFCIANDRVFVIEYSDLADELAEKTNPDGSLVFSLGSIAIHIISRKFIEQLNSKGFALPYHRAVKKIPYIDLDNGEKITPAQPNGIKLETFVFDALPLAKKSIIFETLRSEEFAPVKNATGVDSAEVTREMMTGRAAEWLQKSGVKIPRKADGSPDCTIEISPSFAICQKDVAGKVETIKNISAGQAVYIE